MSVHRGRLRVAAAGVLVLLLTGCSIGGIRRPVPTPPGPSAPASVRPEPLGPDDIRHVPVPVPADYQQKFVEFVDARRGYALFTPCRSEDQGVVLVAECPAVLLATSDGGRSWEELRHPRPMAEFHDPLLVRGERLLLAAGSKHLYHSGDGGRSFTRVPENADSMPPAYQSFFGRFQVSREPAGSGRVIEFTGDRQRPLPNQPPVRGLFMVTGGEGQAPLWAVGMHQGRVDVAVSEDRGESWRTTLVPAPDGELQRAQLMLTSSGEAWLFAHREEASFRDIWRFNDAWERVSAEGRPSGFNAAAPVNGGMLVVTGPNGSGVIVDGRYQDLGWPLGGNEVRALDDDTLFSIHQDKSIWLGEGRQVERRWIKIVLARG